MAVYVTPANEQERAEVTTLTQAVQAITRQHIEVAFVAHGYTGEQAETEAAQGIRLEVVKLPDAKHEFVLLPRWWVVERSFAWLAKFCRLVRDYERLPQIVAGLHFVVFACLMLHHVIPLLAQSA